VAVRTLRWAAAATLQRCEQRIAAACAAWARDWTGHELEAVAMALLDAKAAALLGGRPSAGEPAATPGREPECALQLPSGERVAAAGAEHLPCTVLDAPGAGSTLPGGAAAIAQGVGQACAADLVVRLLAALAEAPAAGAQPHWGPPAAPDPAYAGGAGFGVTVGPLRLHVHLNGSAVARLAGAPPAGPRPQPLDAAMLQRLAGHTRVRGCLRLAGLRLPIGPLLQAEVGDVIVLDRKLDALCEWEVPALGLRVPAQLVRVGDHLAAELMTP
jgi:hypothetical protein